MSGRPIVVAGAGGFIGVNGRNSDNTMIQRELGWEPSIRLRDGMERTYRWIHDEYIGKYGD